MSASRLHAEHDREWIAGDHASSQAPSRKAISILRRFTTGFAATQGDGRGDDADIAGAVGDEQGVTLVRGEHGRG